MLIKTVRKVIKILEESDIEHLEIRRWFWKIRVKKLPFYMRNGRKPRANPHEAISKSLPIKQEAIIKSQMVGTFHQRDSNLWSTDPQTGENNGVPLTIDQAIEVEEIVGYIGAMGLFSPIKSEFSGTVKEILVGEEEPVEYGQELFIIELSSQ